MSTPALWKLHPVVNHNDSKSNPSLLRTPTIPRNSPKKRKIEVDKLLLVQADDKMVDIDSISEQNSTENFTFKRLDNSVQLSNLKCNEEPDIPAVLKRITVDRNLHVHLSQWFTLLQWFRYEHNCTLTKFSMLETLSPI